MFGEEATVVAQVSHLKEFVTRNKFRITDVVLMDHSGGINAKFFNNPYIARGMRARMELVVSGRVDRDLNRLCFKSPEWEPLTKDLWRMLQRTRIYPIYPLTEGVTA